MKTIKTSQNETIKVTKKEIKEYLELERSVSYYSYLDGNTIAHAIAIGQHEFLNGDTSKKEAVDAIYNEIEEVVECYIAYQKDLKDNTL